MSYTYTVGIVDTANITLKDDKLNARIPYNVQITSGTLVSPAGYNGTAVELTFNNQLTNQEINVINNVVYIIYDGFPASNPYVRPRIIQSDYTLTDPVTLNYCDNDNGFMIGDIYVNTSQDQTYVCYDNIGVSGGYTNIGITGHAVWKMLMNTNNRIQEIYYNSGGDVQANQWLLFPSGLVLGSYPENAQILISNTGTISSICGNLTTAPGTGSSREFIVYKGAVGGPIGITGPSMIISDTGTTGISSGGEIDVYPFDLISVYNTEVGTPAQSRAMVTIVLNIK